MSAAQLNSLAICLFLALNLERDSELRTAILDDPVESLDDVNLLSLADVLGQLCEAVGRSWSQPMTRFSPNS